MSSQRLLVIDDVPEMCEWLVCVFTDEMAEVEVACAGGGLEGLALAVTSLPDVVLLDVHMPGIDGLEVCRRLKADARTKHIPVVLITGLQSDLETRTAGLDAGADDFLVKPINNTELVARARVALRVKRAEDKLRQVSHRERLRADQAEELFRVAFETAAAGIVVLDVDQVVMRANPAFVRLFGTKGDIIGQPWHWVCFGCTASCRDTECPLAMTFSSGDAATIERVLTTQDGKVTIELMASPGPRCRWFASPGRLHCA